MSEKTTIKNKQLPGQFEKRSMPLSIFNKPILLSVIVFFILIALFSLLIFQRYQLAKEIKEKKAFEIVHQAKDKLQETLTHSLSATKILTFLIDKNGQVNNFDSVAEQVLETGKDIDAVQLVPEGVIKYVYPLVGNEKVIGYNILEDSTRNKEAYKAIKQNRLFFAGPFELRQGGLGIVGRLPVFRQNKFWGFSAVVIKMTTLFAAAEIDSSEDKGYFFQLSKINPDTKKEEFFLPQHKELTNSQELSIYVPNGEWRLSVKSVANKVSGDLILLALFGFLLAVFGALFVYRFSVRPRKLNELVVNRTSELKKSEYNYRSLIERVSDAFVSLNNNWEFAYLNERAGETLNREPESLLGKNIWKEFPQAKDLPFYQVYHRAMETQQYQYMQEFYPPLDKWLENHVYPSKDGLSIFFRDITDIKEITLALQQKEEKYRTLIEQASDGIVITDMEGIILEVNNSIQQMISFSNDELIGYHLTDFLPEEDLDTNPLRIHELMQGKSLLYERKIRKKDGSLLDVEINSKMASSHTLIGFIRDISERKKIENKLTYQASLLESVSDAVTSLDTNRCIVSWNKACEELYGFTTEDVIGKKIPELVVFEYPHTSNEEMFKQLFAEGKWKGEFNFIHPKTKEKINLLSNVNLLKDSKGVFTGIIITSKNITDRIKTEKEVRKSNERFELIAQATNDAVWDHDFTKNETWGNKNLYNIYGLEYGKDKINFEMFLSRIQPDQRNEIESRMENAIKNSVTSLSEEFVFETANGELRNFYDRAYIKYDTDGKPLRILGAMQDVTDREKAKQLIIKEKELSDDIINRLPGIFYLYNKEGNFLRWNKNFEIVTGYSSEEILHLHPLDLFEGNDKDLIAEKIASVFATGSDDVEADFVLKNGKKIPYYLTGEIIEYEGETCVMGVGLDFSERKKAAQKLSENEKRLQQVLSSSVDNFYVVDLDYTVVLINKAAERNLEIAWGKPVKQGTNLLDVIPENGDEPIKENFEKAFKGKSFEYELKLDNKELPSWVAVRFTPVYDGSDRIVGVSVTARGISERKQAEEVLEESERFLKETQVIAKLGTYTLDITTGQWASSEILNDIFGISSDYERTVESWESIVHPEWREIMSTYFRDDVLGRKIKFDKEYQIVRKNDKEERWVHGIGSLKFNEKGEPVSMVGTIQDVSESKKAEKELFQSEQKYRLLFYNNPLPMWMKTVPGLDIIDVNESAVKLYGYTREEFLKMNTRDLRPAEDIESALEEIDKMQPDSTNQKLWRHKKKDGTIIHVETYSHQITYEGKRVWLSLSHDVTDKHMAEEKLQKSYEDIRQLASNLQSVREDERTTIAREIHDELGQQLTGLKMDIYWLSRKVNPEDKEIKSKLNESIELINATVSSVRKIATDLRPSILDDLGLTAALEWQGEEFEKRSGTRVEFNNRAGDISLKPEAITTVFRIYQELLTNVARHANASIVKVVLQKKNHTLVFSVTDNGNGFAPEITSKKKTLGLLGIKERTSLLGGTYEFKSKPGQGSETIISIPLMQ